MSLLAWHRPRDLDPWSELELLEPSAHDVAPFAADGLEDDDGDDVPYLWWEHE